MLWVAIPLTLLSCSDDDSNSMPENNSIAGIASRAPQFTTLVDALERADLVTTLNASGSFTVFAPTDEAFAKIPKADLDALLKDKAKLSAVKALNLNQEIEDILITLSNQIHIIDISPNKKFMIYLAADASKANLCMTRAILRKHKADVEKNLA